MKKIATDIDLCGHSITNSPSVKPDATKVESSSTNGNIKINGVETSVYTHPTGTNPHGTTKSDVGLGNVGNFKAVSTVASQGLTDTEKSNARANIGAGTSSFSGSYNDLTNKPTIPSTDGLESTSNKVTSISSSSTNTQYPSAKAVYDMIDSKVGNIENCGLVVVEGLLCHQYIV